MLLSRSSVNAMWNGTRIPEARKGSISGPAYHGIVNFRHV